MPRRTDPEGDATEVIVEQKLAPGEQEDALVPSQLRNDVQKTDGAPVTEDTIVSSSVARAGDPQSEPSRTTTGSDAASTSHVAPAHISLWAVLVKLVRSVRADAVFLCTLLYGSADSPAPATLTSHSCHHCTDGSSQARSQHSRCTCKTSGTSTRLKSGWYTSPRSSRRSSVRRSLMSVPNPPMSNRGHGTASTLTGYFVDKLGTGLITVVSLVFSLPWLLVLIVQSSLPLFIVVFALASECLGPSRSRK